MNTYINNLKEKKLNNKGFTIAEMLVTIIILLMVSSIVAAGIPAAINAYNKVVVASNAEVLLSTTVSALRNELGTSRSIVVKGGSGDTDNTVIEYYSEKVHSRSKIFKADGSNDKEPDNTVIPKDTIAYQQYAAGDLNKSDGIITMPLVSDAAATSELYPTYDYVSYDKDTGVIRFTNLAVKRKSDDKIVASMPKKSGESASVYYIRTISY